MSGGSTVTRSVGRGEARVMYHFRNAGSQMRLRAAANVSLLVTSFTTERTERPEPEARPLIS
jgi:hypothetical protein